MPDGSVRLLRSECVRRLAVHSAHIELCSFVRMVSCEVLRSMGWVLSWRALEEVEKMKEWVSEEVVVKKLRRPLVVRGPIEGGAGEVAGALQY